MGMSFDRARRDAASGAPVPGGSGAPRAERRSTPHGDGRKAWLGAAGLGALLLAWTMLIVLVEHVRFVVLAPRAQIGGAAVAAVALLAGALVLLRLPENRGKQQRCWVAGGLLILGLGGLTFGCLLPLLESAPGLNGAVYASLVARTLAGAFFAIALLPARPPRFSRRALLAALAAFGGLGVVAVLGEGRLPPLARIPSLEVAVARDAAVLRGLTGWYWALAALPLGLTIAATVGAVRQERGRGEIRGGWLVVAMTLLAGAQLQNSFWPSAYSPVLTTADLLYLAFGAVVVVGAILELHRIATERAALLESTKRLGHLAALKADFTAMVAHELGSPVAAVRNFADLLATGEVDHPDQAQMLAAIQKETAMLATLVADMRAVALAERDDFAVRPRPVPVRALLDDAAAFARALPGEHPLTVTIPDHEQVWADPERIGQVLRNLLGNAAQYSPAGAPIALRARREAGRLRIEVADRGPGIHPDDLTRIFAKFERGRQPRDREVAGLGLGLYLSRRILQAHGAELTVTSSPGAGAVFGFALEVTRGRPAGSG